MNDTDLLDEDELVFEATGQAAPVVEKSNQRQTDVGRSNGRTIHAGDGSGEEELVREAYKDASVTDTGKTLDDAEHEASGGWRQKFNGVRRQGGGGKRRTRLAVSMAVLAAVGTGGILWVRHNERATPSAVPMVARHVERHIQKRIEHRGHAAPNLAQLPPQLRAALQQAGKTGPQGAKRPLFAAAGQSAVGGNGRVAAGLRTKPAHATPEPAVSRPVAHTQAHRANFSPAQKTASTGSGAEVVGKEVVSLRAALDSVQKKLDRQSAALSELPDMNHNLEALRNSLRSLLARARHVEHRRVLGKRGSVARRHQRRRPVRVAGVGGVNGYRLLDIVGEQAIVEDERTGRVAVLGVNAHFDGLTVYQITGHAVVTNFGVMEK